MIDTITSEELRSLAATASSRCVSLFLPTHQSGPEQVQDPIRLKNLLARAAAELGSLGLRSPEVERLLAPATALHDTPGFWAHQEAGLAIFLNDGAATTFRLAEPLEELVIVADRFHLKPLIASLATGKTFYLLALSQHQVRLLQGSPSGLTEIELGEMPQSLAEALWWDDRERQLQSHAAGRSGQGGVVATFHGQGVARDTTKADLARFFRAVDDGVEQLITDRAAPLVLAGVEHLLAIYRGVTHNRQIIAETIRGNPEHLSLQELHASAWPLVAPVLDRGRAEAIEHYMMGAAPRSDDLVEVVVAADAGRVATLFVPTDREVWGRLDPATSVVEQHDSRQPGDRDLLDVAALATSSHGGTVYTGPVSDIPGGGLLAAVLRYQPTTP